MLFKVKLTTNWRLLIQCFHGTFLVVTECENLAFKLNVCLKLQCMKFQLNVCENIYLFACIVHHLVQQFISNFLK